MSQYKTPTTTPARVTSYRCRQKLTYDNRALYAYHLPCLKSDINSLLRCVVTSKKGYSAGRSILLVSFCLIMCLLLAITGRLCFTSAKWKTVANVTSNHNVANRQRIVLTSCSTHVFDANPHGCEINFLQKIQILNRFFQCRAWI